MTAILLGDTGAARRIGLFGVPYDTSAGIGRPGARYAPARIREALRWNLNRIRDGSVFDLEARRLVRLDVVVEDYDDVFVSGHDHLATLERARALMTDLLEGARFPIALGGDHSISWPLLRAFHDHHGGRLGIVQLDAHLDLVDENARQGRYSGSSPIRRALELERYEPENVAQVGVRGFNYPDQYEYVTQEGIHHITAAEVHTLGGAGAAESALAIAGAGGARVYLTIDIDCLDPAFAPGSGADEPGGLTSRQILDMVRVLAPRVDAMDIVEVNPPADQQDQTSTLAAQIIFTALVAREEASS